jgi:PilZ domain-containing protein
MNVYRVEARSHPRFKLEIDIWINSRTCGRLKGHTIDISESGIAAMLTLEAPLGEILELDFTLPSGTVIILAMVRQRNAFRYGFEFVDTDSMHEIIRRTCRDLAIDQSVLACYPVTRALTTRKSQALAADSRHRSTPSGINGGQKGSRPRPPQLVSF